jgi:tetratricopeptide (TPR) repeat protein
MSARRSLCWVVLIFGLVLSGGARADEAANGPPPEAKKAFADGKAAFERGDYETALQMFQRAMLIAPAPSLYYNIGVAYERLGRYEDSAIAFETYLREMEAPTNDEERAFQAKLRARAVANRDKARTAPVPPRRVEPSPPPPAYPPSYPGYVYPTYAPPPAYMPPPAPPLTHQQKLFKARRHRNNAIALLAVGSTFFVAGVGLTAWAAAALPVHRTSTSILTGEMSDDGGLAYGLTIWGTASLVVIGLPLAIPGALALAKWQKELTAEMKRPDDGASAAKAALDLAVPPLRMSNDAALVLTTPPIRF